MIIDRSDRSIKTPRSENFGAEKTKDFQNAIAAVLHQAREEKELKAEAISIIRWLINVGRGKVVWVHYQTASGKRFATFLSPKAFQGYWWNEKRTITVNLATGAKYRVFNNFCDCQDWYEFVRTGLKTECKHQEMKRKLALSGERSPQGGNSENGAGINSTREGRKNNLYTVYTELKQDGLRVELANDGAYKEYYLKAWLKEDAASAPVEVRIGKIIESETGFIARSQTLDKEATVSYQFMAIAWLIRDNNLDYNKDILPAYKESLLPRIPRKNGTLSEGEIATRRFALNTPKIASRQKRPKIIRSATASNTDAIADEFADF